MLSVINYCCHIAWGATTQRKVSDVVCFRDKKALFHA